MDLEQLYKFVKPIVWVLTMKGDFKGKSIQNRQTGFAVKDGFIMTGAHGNWPKWSNLVVKARPLCTTSTEHDAVFVAAKRDYGISLFRIEKVRDMPVGRFGSGELEVGETLMSVCHPYDLVGSGMIGRVLYPCVANPEFSMDNVRRIFDDSNTNTCEIWPSYKVMGHVLDEDAIREAEKNENHNIDSDFLRNLKSYLPIIQTTSGLVSGFGLGASGSAMFNLEGEIIGMHILSVKGYDIGVHVGVLLRFLESTNTITGTAASSGHSKAVAEASEDQRKVRRRRNCCHWCLWCMKHVSSWCRGRV